MSEQEKQPEPQQPQAEDKSQQQAEKLLSAVERILDSDDKLFALVDKARERTDLEPNESRDDDAFLRRVAKWIVADFSNRAAITGGVTALPAILPGAGTLVTALGGTLADMTLTLKFEVEMALALTHLFGFDIKQHNERQIAFLLASVSTYDAKTGKNLLRDLIATEGTAIWNYAPRQLSKFLISVLGKLILVATSKSLAKLIPLVGVVVGTSVNKILTTKVGERCTEELSSRRKVKQQEAKGPVVDAVVQ